MYLGLEVADAFGERSTLLVSYLEVILGAVEAAVDAGDLAGFRVERLFGAAQPALRFDTLSLQGRLGLVERAQSRLGGIDIAAHGHVLHGRAGQPATRLLELAIGGGESILQMHDEVAQIARGEFGEFDLGLLMGHLTVGDDVAGGQPRHGGGADQEDAQCRDLPALR